MHISYFPSYRMRRRSLLADLAFARRLRAPRSLIRAVQLRLAELREVRS